MIGVFAETFLPFGGKIVGSTVTVTPDLLVDDYKSLYASGLMVISSSVDIGSSIYQNIRLNGTLTQPKILSFSVPQVIR